jgi:hypothetical protein
MIKFLWCLGHHGSGRFESVSKNDWKCMDCGAVMERRGLGYIEPNGDLNWKLVEEVTNDPDQGAV